MVLVHRVFRPGNARRSRNSAFGGARRGVLAQAAMSSDAPLDRRARCAPARQGAADRRRSRDQDDRTRALRRRAARRDAARHGETARNSPSDAEALSARIRKFDAFALVVGLPLNMDGGEGPRAQATRAFAAQFRPPRSDAGRVLGRAPVDRRRRSRADRQRRLARAPRRGRRPDGRRLYPAGRARPPRADGARSPARRL